MRQAAMWEVCGQVALMLDEAGLDWRGLLEIEEALWPLASDLAREAAACTVRSGPTARVCRARAELNLLDEHLDWVHNHEFDALEAELQRELVIILRYAVHSLALLEQSVDDVEREMEIEQIVADDERELFREQRTLATSLERLGRSLRLLQSADRVEATETAVAAITAIGTWLERGGTLLAVQGAALEQLEAWQNELQEGLPHLGDLSSVVYDELHMSLRERNRRPPNLAV